MEHIKINIEKLERYFNGDYSDADAEYVEDLFNDESKSEELEHILSRKYYEILDDNHTVKKDLDHILYKLNYDIITQIAKEKNNVFARSTRMVFRIASMIIIVLSVCWGVKNYINLNKVQQTFVEIKAPAWTRVQFSLPDGTTGWLNSKSAIKYNGTFLKTRNVHLNGEAYFDVVKQPDNPFTVTTNNISIKVLGTKFNVASYDDEVNLEVVLEEGQIELKSKFSNETIKLKPNDFATYNKQSNNISLQQIQVNKYISWKDGKLIFRNDPVDVIARRLARWYNIDVEVTADFNDDLRLRATFMDESLEEVLYFLERSLPLSTRIETREIQPDETYARKKVYITKKPLNENANDMKH
jgi:transmembrane sensor